MILNPKIKESKILFTLLNLALLNLNFLNQIILSFDQKEIFSTELIIFLIQINCTAVIKKNHLRLYERYFFM